MSSLVELEERVCDLSKLLDSLVDFRMQLEKTIVKLNKLQGQLSLLQLKFSEERYNKKYKKKVV